MGKKYNFMGNKNEDKEISGVLLKKSYKKSVLRTLISQVNNADKSCFSLILTVFFAVFMAVTGWGQVTVSGAVTGNGPYTTLGAAFTAIGTSQAGANINIAISGNTTEAAIASLGAGSWSSVTISPSGGAWTISGNLASELIQFNGADNVTINGLNSGGNALTISNTNTSTTAGTIKFLADASNNTITNCSVLGSTTVLVNPPSTVGGVIFFGTGTTTGNDGNTISNCKITAAGTNLPSKLIGSIGSTTTSAIANSGNTITNCELYDFFTPVGCSAAIYAAAGNTDWTITNNKIYQTATRTFTGTSGFLILYGIAFNSPTVGENTQITGNTFGYANSTGTGNLVLDGPAVVGEFQGIYLNSNPAAATACNINNNTFANISMTSSTGRFYAIYNGAGATSNTININGNTFRNIATTTSTAVVNPIYAGTAATLNCNNNIIDTVSRTGAGDFYAINYGATPNITVSGNTISNLSFTAAASTNVFAGIFSNVASVIETITGNTITGLTSSSTVAQMMYGINAGTGAGNKTIKNNSLSNLSLPSTGTGSIYGIRMPAGGALNEVSGATVNSFSGGTNIYGISVAAGTTNTVYKNKVYGLSASVAIPVVQGISISGGTTTTVYNNIVGGLTTPSANTANPLNGIYISGGTTVNVYYNTVRLNASSVGALFGSSAVYAATAPTVNFRNNIFVNESTVAGAGLAAAYRRSTTTLTSYASTSDNNLFYGSTIFTDGTNTDATLAAFKTRVALRDVSSVTETPTYVSTVGSNASYLHIDTTVATQIESGGASIAGYANDFDGDVRNASTPDIGADEFAGIVNDLTGPVIAHTPDPACVSGSRMISATFTDASGIPTTGAGLPVAYWKLNSGAYTAATGTPVGSGVYNFTIGTGSVNGDTISYYFVAQDNVATPNVSVYPALGATGFGVNPPSSATPPTSPIKLLTPMVGNYTVGAGGNYTTVTAAVADYNTRCLGGAVTFTLTDVAYGSETYPIIIQQNNDASLINTLTIKPAPSVAATISGTLASELIQFNGADYVIFDGLNSGGSSLTISNTSTAATAYTIKFQSDATNNAITNCSVLGSTTVANATAGGVIFFGTGTASGNDGNIVSNCNVGPAGTNLPSKLIGSLGSTASATIANSGITITNCNLYDYFLTSGCAAVYVGLGNTDWTITNNRIYQTGTRTFTAAGSLVGISFNSSTYGNNIQITGNTMGYANSAGTGNMVFTGSTVAGEILGIYFSSSTTAANACNINNNIFSNISLDSSSGRFLGIYIATPAGSSTINVNSNVVKNIATTTTTGVINPIYAGAATTVNCNNNVINNISRTGAGDFYGINYGATPNITVSGNTISNLSSTAAASANALAGIFSNAASAIETITGNTITGLTSSSTAAQTIYGINTGTGNSNKTVQNNILTNISVPAGATGAIHGIRMTNGGALNIVSGNTVASVAGPNSGLNGFSLAAGTAVNVYNNKVYGLNGPGAVSTVNGFAITAGGTYTVYNNIIGDLTTPSANAANPLNGINISGGTTVNLYNNTVRINASSTGATFGSSAVYAVTGTTVDFRNNIFSNESTPAGAGLAAVYRRSSPTLNTYASTSNNNLFYGNPIFTDGTNTDATLPAFQTRLGNRDGLSVTESPTFVSTVGSDATYLHIETTVPTQIESGGAVIASVTNDFDGEVRNASTPDIGADEFTGIVSDLVGPVITHIPDPACAAGSRTISATFTDATGVPTSGTGLPVAYWRINAGGYTAEIGTDMGSGVYNFTIGTGSVPGDMVSYYFVAQDIAATPNISVYPSLGAAGFSSDPPAVATPTTAPLTLKTPMVGVYTVGSTGTYTTLTAAVADYNVRCLGGPVTFSLLDTTYPSETFPIAIQQNNDASLVNTLTIKPASGVAATISGGLAAELIQLNGADYIIIDGVNTGGSTLTITNTDATATAGVATIKFMADATNNTVTNCKILGSGQAVAGTAGGVVYFAPGTTTGNDGNTISYCNIGPAGATLPVKLIYSSGLTTSEAVCNSEITITGCNLYDFFIAGSNSAAVYATTGSSAWNITNNRIYQTGTRTFTGGFVMYGIYFSNSTYGNNVRITGNTIGYANSAGTGVLNIAGGAQNCGFYGIYNATSSTASNTCYINDNIITDITLTSTGLGANYGINNGTTASSNTVNIEGNTIRNISIVGNTGNLYGIFGGAATNLNCNNNRIEALTRNGNGIFYGLSYGAATTVTVNGNAITNLSFASASGTSAFAGIYGSAASLTETVNNNTITGLISSSTGAQTIYGINIGSGNQNKTIQNNTLTNISVPAAATSTINGIRMANAGALNVISGNTISSIAGPNKGGGNGINGMFLSAGTVNNIYNNKIWGLNGPGAASGVIGFAVTAGGTYNFYNNIIGDLTAPTATDGGAEPHVVIGINSWGMPMNLYNNTIVLNGTNTGTNFGSSAVYSGGPLLMQNNILINNLPSRGTGVSVVLRLAGGVAPYNAASDHNLFYGTNIHTKTGVTNLDQTLADFKIRLNNPVVGTRDLASVTGAPAFLSTVGSNANYLHIDPSVPTQIDSGGMPVATVTDDFDGDVRNASTPDIGADEFSGTPITLAAINTVGASSTGNQCATNSRTITANITAGTNGMTWVKLYYYFNGTAQTPIVMTGGNLTAGTTSDFTATIPAASPSNATVTWIVAVSEPATAKLYFGTSYTSVTNTWNGTTWSTGAPPTASEKVVFAGNYSSTTDLTGCSCQVNSGNVVINPGNTMSMVNGITVSGGSLTFEDTSSLLQTDPAAVNSGNITYKRKTTPLKQYDYTYWSSPVGNAPLSQLVTNSLFYAFDPLINNWAQQSGSATMVNGQGYIGRAPNGLDYSTPQIVETNFSGVPNNGTIATAITKGSGTLNLIGNPYPSAIDIDLFLTDPANSGIVDGTIYLWTHNTAISSSIPGNNTYNYTVDDYAKYNLTGGVATASPALTGGAVPTGKIPAGEGFFIDANAGMSNGTYSASFKNTMRVQGNNTQFFRSNHADNTTNSTTVTLEKHRLWISLSNSQGGYNEALVGYIEGATNGMDRLFDGKTLASENRVSIYSMLANNKLSIQGRSLPFSANDVVPIGYTTSLNGIMSITLENFDGLFANQDVYLFDRTTGMYHDLKASAFSFTTASGTFNDRFELHFTANTLGVHVADAAESIRVVAKPHQLSVLSGNPNITGMEVYDLTGKLLYSKKCTSTANFTADTIPASSQMLIVKVTLEDKFITVKKVLMP